MGCNQSKFEPGEDAQLRLRPAWRRFPDIRRHRDGGRVRKDHTVSTAELLRRRREHDDDASSLDRDSVSKATIEDAGENKEKESATKKGVFDEEEELLGSPSFRFYFQDAAAGELNDEELVKAITKKSNGVSS